MEIRRIVDQQFNFSFLVFQFNFLFLFQNKNLRCSKSWNKNSYLKETSKIIHFEDLYSYHIIRYFDH